MNDSAEAQVTHEERGPYFASAPHVLGELQSSLEEPLWHEFGFQLSDEPAEPNQLEFNVLYGHHTHMTGPALFVSIGVVNDGWKNVGKIQVHIYEMGGGSSRPLYAHFDSPTEILPAIRLGNL